MHKTIMLALLLTCGLARGAEPPPNVDWKFYGTATLGGQDSAAFYESVGVVRRPNGYIEVWTKGLLASDILKFQKTDKEFLDRVKNKSNSDYEMPYAGVVKIDKDAKLALMVLEDAANSSHAEPIVRVLYEFDCAGRMERSLSEHFSVGGKVERSETASTWHHIAPETGVDTLMKILCPRM
jgi:hypothetical protein